MFCKRCGAEMLDGARFCAKCGEKMVSNNPQQRIQNNTNDIKKASPKIKKKYAMITIVTLGVLILAVLLFVARLFFNIGANRAKDQTISTQSVENTIDTTMPQQNTGKETSEQEVPESTEDVQNIPMIHNADNMILAYMRCVLDATDSTGYGVYDIDKDGVKELILRTQTTDGWNRYAFYTYVDGYVVELGTMDCSNSYLYDSNGTLILVNEEGDQEKDYAVRTLGGKIVCEVLTMTEKTDGEKSYFAQFPQVEFIPRDVENPWGSTYDLFNNLVSEGAYLVEPEIGVFQQTDNSFTNNRLTVTSLQNGWVVVVNAENLEIVSVFQLMGEEASVVGVTRNAIYVKSIEYFMEDGRIVLNVTAYNYDGSVRNSWTDFNKVWFEAGHLIMQYTREYIYPMRTSVIDPYDNLVLAIDELWDAGVCNGELYYLLPVGFSGIGESQVEIYKLENGTGVYCGMIAMHTPEDGSTYADVTDNMIVIKTERLDTSDPNWENWEVIVTEECYTLEGILCES